MKSSDLNFEAFMRPKSIAIIGATERPDTWGNWITRRLTVEGFPGTVYPINPKAKNILGLKAYKSVASVPGSVDLAVIAIPSKTVFDAVRDCVEKKVPAAVMITAGFREARIDGKKQEQEMVAYAKEHGLRLVGPNVSGIMNLNYNMVAHPAESQYLCKTPITFLCQGGFAITDLAARESSARRGFGKFLHTGNEADVDVVDFLEYCEQDPETEGICLYMEGIKDAKRFIEVTSRITPKKPIVAFKAGVSISGGRAAASHTGAIAGSADMCQALFKQAGIVQTPTFELCLNIAHALIEMPPLRKPTIGITTLGGSWGVMLTDALEGSGLHVPELTTSVQEKMRELGMPVRASVRNPVDFGAAAGSVPMENRLKIVEILMECEEIGGIASHGFGRPGFFKEDAPAFVKQRAEEEKAMIRGIQALERVYRKPVLHVTAMRPLESQVVRDMIGEGFRFQHRLEDVAAIFKALNDYNNMHGGD